MSTFVRDLNSDTGGSNLFSDTETAASFGMHVPTGPELIYHCTADTDCPSGACVPAPEGRFCSVPCAGQPELCPAGWVCGSYTPAGGPPLAVCIPEPDTLCLTCTADADCQEPGDLCLDLEDGRYCGDDCREHDCPAGYDCLQVQNLDGSRTGLQCVPARGTCGCPDPDGDGYGLGPTCAGSDCSESDPEIHAGAAETCNGADDDCDGSTDEDDPGGGEACGSSVGECRPGTWHCREGELVCEGAVEGTPEECNGLDDDCDGSTDEDFQVGQPCVGLGRCAEVEGVRECAGPAQVRCSTMPGGSAAHSLPDELADNGVDDDCDGSVDEETDRDRDGVPDAADLCPDEPDPGQEDGDADGRGDACDLCPAVFDPEQLDSDGDGRGDACDPAPRCFDYLLAGGWAAGLGECTGEGYTLRGALGVPVTGRSAGPEFILLVGPR